MIGFSKNVTKWMSRVTLADEERCHEAIEWISRLSADGNTCTLQAIQVALILIINCKTIEVVFSCLFLILRGKITLALGKSCL